VIVLALTPAWLDYNTPRITGLALCACPEGFVREGQIIHPLALILSPL
jgi:hypothetical protein